MDLFNYSRRESSEVNIGATPLGGNNPIRIQSMTNTVTMDTEACVEQAKRIIDAGGEYVRLTTQGVREAENLKNINIGLRSQGYDTPLVADVHFNPKVADVAAQYAESPLQAPGCALLCCLYGILYNVRLSCGAPLHSSLLSRVYHTRQ